MALSVIQLANRLQTEADAWKLLEEWRWGDEPRCSHCGCTDVHFIEPTNGETRATRTGSQSARRVWKCHKRGGGCGKQFTVTVGTIFHRTKVPIRTWLFVLFEMVASKNGVAAREIERKYDLTNKTAWFVLHRIREAMKRDSFMEPMTGTVEADETFIGGKAKNMHEADKRRKGTPLGGAGHMVPVMTLVNRETGEARSRIVPDVTGETLGRVLHEEMDPSAHLMTDQHKGYREAGRKFAQHSRVDHSQGEYVRGTITTNRAEGFFSQLKRSVDGTHHHVSRQHLHRYLAEFDFRYSTRELSDERRLDRLIGQTGGRRLTYKPLTGKDA